MDLFATATQKAGLSGVTLGPTAKTTILVLLGAIAVLTLLLVVDYFYPFLPFSTFTRSLSTGARSSKTFWKTVQADSENLIVPVTLSNTKRADQWTCSAQLILADSRTPSPGYYRHILHRGSNPIGLSSTTAGSTGHAGIQPSDISGSSTDPSYTQTGLPEVMNPGVFLDKYKNDIHIFIHTRGKEKDMDVLWLESMTVQDVPLKQPITLNISCNGRQLDVYVNCRLYSSMLLRGTPYLPATDAQWFGRYGAYPFTGLIKNLTLWSTPLESTDMLQVCRSDAASFSPTSLPASSCSK